MSRPRGRMTRRAFLGSAAGAAAGLVLGRASGFGHFTRRAPREADVVVVGGGLSGLVAAARIAGPGKVGVVVLEAAGEVGGRTRNLRLATGHVVDGGGEWVGPSQTAILDLARELSIETCATYDTGDAIYHLGGSREIDPTWALTPGDTIDAAQLALRIEAMSRRVPLESPWRAPDAEAWDALTVGDWLGANALTEGGAGAIASAVSSTLGDPAEVSLLYYLFYVHSAGSFVALEAVVGGAQERRLVGGAQGLALGLASRLGPDRAITGAPVRRIADDPAADRVRVESDAGEILAREVVVAMSPGAQGRIEFAPALPEARRRLSAAWKGEHALKFHVAYPTPFWREAGLSGQSVSDTLAVGMTFDESPADLSAGLLVGFVETGSGVPEDPGARRAAVLEALAVLFGEEAANPADYAEMDWSRDPWSHGCVSPIGPGVLTSCGPALRERVGRIHWAGTESSTVWMGYMEGAVRAGERAAREVLSALEAK